MEDAKVAGRDVEEDGREGRVRLWRALIGEKGSEADVDGGREGGEGEAEVARDRAVERDEDGSEVVM